MNKYVRLLLCFAACLGLGSLLLWQTVGMSHSAPVSDSQVNTTGQPDEFERLNTKARAANNGGLIEVQELAEAVVQPYGGNSAGINEDGTVDEVKVRLARAELDYRQGRANGISEDNVVRLINGLCIKFQAPDYLTTDRLEVRTHRMAMLHITPQLTTFKRAKQRINSATDVGGINVKMSPIEAANIAMSLIYQKIYNEDYQQNASERAAFRKEQRTAIGIRLSPKKKPLIQVSPRLEEVQNMISRGSISLIFPGQMKAFAHRALDILGIPR